MDICMNSLFSNNMYLELNLNAPVMQGIFPLARQKSPLEVFRVIEKAGKDNRIRGIILNTGNFSCGMEYLWELRNALSKFKSSGKKICAFLSDANIDNYCMASVADKIVMDEQGTLSLLGYAWSRDYMRRSLEKLGIGVREMRYFEYKSAAEKYTRDSMSEADLKQYGEYLDDIFNLTRTALMNARNLTDEEFDLILNREFIYSAKSAKDRGLIDYIGGKAAVTEALKEIEGEEVKHFVLYGETVSSLTGDQANYNPPKTGGLLKKSPEIAVVYANGQTDLEKGIAAWSLSQTLRELAEKRRVKAIVIRINSPGGSADAADLFAEAVRYAKQKKPVVVSMGQAAASGGYWAAMNASHITATPYTITGSIGVIASWFYDNGLGSKLGFSIDTIQRGLHSDLLTGFLIPHRDLTDEEEERYKVYIMDMYGVFTAKAAAARGMEIEKIEAVAQGRVFSGAGALNAGLIDSIGGICDALDTARELAKIPQGRSVVYREYPKPKFTERLLSYFRHSLNFPANSGGKTNAVKFFADIRYRLERNGQVMPVLPLSGSMPFTL